MTDFFNKIKNSCLGQKCCFLCRPAGDDAEAAVMPVSRLMFGPFGIFADNLKNFLQLGAVFAFFLFVWMLLCGFSVACAVAEWKSSLLCAVNPDRSIYIYLPVKVFLATFFMAVWYRRVFQNGALSLKEVLLPHKRDFKFFVFVLVFMLLNAVPLLSFYLLASRVPNPDWRVEAAYFTVVAVGFLVPFVLMRFYALFAFAAGGEGWPPLPLLWRKTEGNMLKILLSLFMLFILLAMVMVNYAAAMTRLISAGEIIPILISEYVYGFVFLILAALAINHCAVQKELLFPEKTGEE